MEFFRVSQKMTFRIRPSASYWLRTTKYQRLSCPILTKYTPSSPCIQRIVEPTGSSFFWSFLTKTKEDQALLSHIHGKIWPRSTQIFRLRQQSRFLGHPVHDHYPNHHKAEILFFFQTPFWWIHWSWFKKQKKSGCIVCNIPNKNTHHQWTWRESFLLLTNSVSQQWLPVHQNYIIFLTFPVHRFHDAVMVFASLVHILESPLHGKKTWGAQ